jgi:M6 family metalloprotease-like protein
MSTSMTVRLERILMAVCVLAAMSTTAVWAGPANPQPFALVQPDGTPFIARLVGDEWSNATETIDGFTVVQDQTSGFWVYADKVNGSLVPTSLVVGRDAPDGLTPRLRADSPLATAAADAASTPMPAPALGTRRTLVLLTQFQDKAASTSAASWQGQFFGATNSVKDHYAVSSYGQVSIAPATESSGTANDGIVGWLTLASNHPNTGGNIGVANQQLTKDAILAANPFVDFASYDTNGNGRLTPDELMVIVIVAGNESAFGTCTPGVWGHKWSVVNIAAPVVDGVTVGADGYAQFGEMHCASASPPGQIATIGIMAHEMGHLLGLPDLYDTDGSSQGIGNWSLMAGGSWTGLSRFGDSPALLDPWSKFFLGWVTPTLVTGTLTNQSIPSAETSSTLFQFLSGSALTGTGQYFLVENRQRVSYDAALPGSGLLVWHIDEARSGNTAECVPGGTPACSSTVHYKVAVVPADNLFDLERGVNRGDAGDPFPGSTNKQSLTDSTTPSSRLWTGTPSGASIQTISASGAVMTATLSQSAAAPGAFNKSAPSNGATAQSTTATLSWGASDGASSYAVCLDTTNNNSCDAGAFVSVGNVTSAAVTSQYPGGLALNTTYYWQVQASNAVGTTAANSNTWWSFTTQATQAPGPFGKSSPANGATGLTTSPVLAWDAASGATGYEYCFDTTNDSSCSAWTATQATSVNTSGLGLNTTYYWQVRASNGGGTTYANGTSTAFWSFTTSSSAADLFEPDNTAAQATTLAPSPRQSHTFHVNGDVDWARFTATSGVQYTIDTSSLGAGVDTLLYLYAADTVTLIASDDDGGGGLSSRIVHTASSNGPLFVRVAQYNGVGIGGYELGMSFLPGTFGKVAPANGATGQSSSTSLSWGTSAGATDYEYCIDTSNDNACSTWVPLGSATSVSPNGLSASTTYYWQVRSSSGGAFTYADGSSTAFWSFTTSAAPTPDIRIQPTSLTLTPGDAAKSFTVFNDGTATLNVTGVSLDSSAGWVSWGPQSFSVPAGGQQAVDVTVNFGSAPSGQSTRRLLVSSNDPDESPYPNGVNLTMWGAPGAFGKSMPLNGVTINQTDTVVAWNSSGGATAYEYCIDATNDNACTNWVSTGTSTGAMLAGLAQNTTYYWQVRALNTGGTTYANGSATAFWSFTTTSGPLPGAFSKTSPANGARGEATSLTLTWNSSANATGYEYCLSPDASQTCNTWTSTGTNTSLDLIGLAESTKYRWQVRATNTAGTTYADGSFTAFSYFTTASPTVGRSIGDDVSVKGDFDGDGRTELAVYRPSTGEWFIRNSSAGYAVGAGNWYFQWGLGGDLPIVGDFDDDGKAEITVYRPTTGEWFIRYSSLGYNVGAGNWYMQWGLVGDIPLAVDFDGDGKSDLAIYRPTTGEWLIRNSSAGYALGAGNWYYQWGLAGDLPAAADFDGDHRADPAVYRPSTGQWLIRNSASGYVAGAGNWYFQWGLPGDQHRLADIDGDGKIDPTVYRPTTGEWFVRYSSLGYVVGAGSWYFDWGLSGDTPRLGDFDGDGRMDPTVYRPDTGEWLILYSSTSYDVTKAGLYQWGLDKDMALPTN